MAQYKVIQDIEAEDKIAGPFSLRQFIYAGIAVFFGWLGFLAISNGAPFLVAAFAPPMLFCMFFAWPWSPDQPTEVWALARISFYFKPRKRIWDQSGLKELVTITVPKRVEKVFTNGLSQIEVKSRLTALADTLDSRGWAVKNANVNVATNQYSSAAASASDRLIDYSNMPQEVPNLDVQAADDMLDEANNPVARQFDQMINASSQARRTQLLQQMNDQAGPILPAPAGATAAAAPANDYWFLHQNDAHTTAAPGQGSAVFADAQIVPPGLPVDATATPPAADEAAMAAALKAAQPAPQQSSYSHLKNIQPIDPNHPTPPPQTASAGNKPVPPVDDTAILNLASNNDLNVATLARQAHKAREPEDHSDEVVVTLH